MPLIETAEQLVAAILERPRYVAECLQRLHRFGGQFSGCNAALGLNITAEHEITVARHDIDVGNAEHKHGDNMLYFYQTYGPNDRVTLFELMLKDKMGVRS
jgi:hypothetical protein